MSDSNEKRRTVFRRINGRIVPISLAAGGSYAAFDGARTRRIYDKGGVTIDRKRFAFQPFVPDKLGTRLEMRKGKDLVGTASYYKAGDNYSFSWLGIKSKFRGQGFSKPLSKVAAQSIKKDGGTKIFNQVVHPGSLNTNFSRKRDTLFKLGRNQHGEYFKKITKAEATKNIKTWRNVKGILTSDVFRETSLKGIRTSHIKPILTRASKVKIGAGLVAALTGIVLLKTNKDK